MIVDFVVPKSQCQKAVRRKNPVAMKIARGLRGLRMLAAIAFNDQAMLEANKIQDIAFQRRLAPKMQTLRTQGPKTQPKLDLMPRHALAQLPRALDRGSGRRRCHHRATRSTKTCLPPVGRPARAAHRVGGAKGGIGAGQSPSMPEQTRAGPATLAPPTRRCAPASPLGGGRAAAWLRLAGLVARRAIIASSPRWWCRLCGLSG